jgi:hypothetical protein
MYIQHFNILVKEKDGGRGGMMIGWTNEEDNKEIQEKGGKDVNV